MRIKGSELRKIIKEEISRLAEAHVGNPGDYELKLARRARGAADIRDKYRSMAPVVDKPPGRYMMFNGKPVGEFWNSMIDKDIEAHGMAPGNINIDVDDGPFQKGTRGEYSVKMSDDKEFSYAAEVSIYDRSFGVEQRGQGGGMTPHEAIKNALGNAERAMMLPPMGDED